MVILVMMQASKKIPFDDPMVLNGVRALYVFSNVVILSIYLYVQMQINKKNGGTTLCSRPTWSSQLIPLQTRPPYNTLSPLRWARPRRESW